MCSMVKLIWGTTEDIIMPAIWLRSMPLCRIRFIMVMPYSSDVRLRLVEMRQYWRISMPSNSAVFILVLPMSSVRIMEPLQYYRASRMKPALYSAAPIAPVSTVETAISTRPFTPTAATM